MASLAHSIPQTNPSGSFRENAGGREGRLEEVWVSSREAARVLGKTTDYIARLCREGALECRQEGRAWCVQAASMVRFSQRSREVKESIRQAKSERLRQWWEAQQWWKSSAGLLSMAQITRMIGVTLLLGGIGLTGAAFFGYEWAGRTLSVSENATVGILRETKDHLNTTASWLWSVFPKWGFLSSGQGGMSVASPVSSVPGVVIAPFNAGEKDATRRITALFSEPVGVEPQDDRSGVVRSWLAPEEPFLYVMVPVHSEPQTSVSHENTP